MNASYFQPGHFLVLTVITTVTKNLFVKKKMTLLLPAHVYESVEQLEFLDDTSYSFTFNVTTVAERRLGLSNIIYVDFVSENSDLIQQIFRHALQDANSYMQQIGTEFVTLFSIRFGGQTIEVDENMDFNSIVNFAQQRTTPFQLDPVENMMQQVSEIMDIYGDTDENRIHTLRVFTIWAVTTNRIYVPEFDTDNYSQMTQINRGYFDIFVDKKKAVYFSPGTYSNCLFHAVHFCLRAKDYLEMLSKVPDNIDKRIEYLDKMKVTITKRGHDLKANLLKKRNINEEDLYTIEVLQEISEYCKVNIFCLDHKLKVLHSFKPKTTLLSKYSIKNVNLQIVATSSSIHCISVVKKEDCLKLDVSIDSLYSTVDSQSSFDLNRNVYNANMLIEKEKESRESNPIVVYDIETYFYDKDRNKINHTPYMMGIAWGSEPEEYKQFDSNELYSCVYHFWAYVLMNWTDFQNKTFFAHNGAKFDCLLIIKEIPNTLEIFDVIVQEGAIISFKICQSGMNEKERKENYIMFRDSIRILPGSLDSLCKSFNVKNQKLTFDYHAVTAQNYKEFIPKCKEYLMHDCLGLYQVLSKVETESPGYTSYVTSSSAAQSDFYLNYYKPDKYPVYRLSDELDTFIRRSYRGGRVEAYKIGKIVKSDLEEVDDEGIPAISENYKELLQNNTAERLYYYDINSLYPFAGCKPMPYGKPEVVKYSNIVFDENGKIQKSFYGFVEVIVSGPTKGKKPLHSLQKDGKLQFPFLKRVRQVIFSEEIRLAQEYELGYEYEFVQAVMFQSACTHEEFFRKNYSQRLVYKKEGKDALAYVTKLKINGKYGRDGIKVVDRDSIEFKKLKDKNSKLVPQIKKHVFKNMYNGKLKGWLQFKDYVIIRKLDRLKVSNNNVAIACAIVTWGRMLNYIWQMKCFENNINVYYTDTDSFITDKPITWDCGKELGQIKNEADEMVEDALKSYMKSNNVSFSLKEAIDAEIALEPNGVLSFDQCYILGPKNYCLVREWKSEILKGVPKIVKKTCKGIKKSNCVIKYYIDSDGDKVEMDPPQSLNENHYILMCQGCTIFQSQERFISGKSTIMDANDPVVIRMETIEKKCRMLYEKGIVESDNTISPFTFEIEHENEIFLSEPKFMLKPNNRSLKRKIKNDGGTGLGRPTVLEQFIKRVRRK